MEAGGVLPGRDPPARAEVVHESGRTRVTRHFLPGRTVISKEPLGPDAERRVRHEVAVLERLRGVAGVNPAVPAPFSEVIMHLLEKEPDNRYQTADGLVYDLEQVQDAQARPAAAALRVGEHDVRARLLLPPSRLVGRDDEVAALGTALGG